MQKITGLLLLLATRALLVLADTQTCVNIYGQCGGTDYTGPTCCQTGSVCQFQSSCYSQCIPSTDCTETPLSTTTTTIAPTSSATVTSTSDTSTATTTTTTTLTTSATTASTTTGLPNNSTATLRSLADARGIYFGCAVDNDEITNSSLAALAGTQCGLTTPGNAMKWFATEPTQGVFSYTLANEILAFATANNMKVRGHTLVWYSQLAPWVTDGVWTNETLTAVMVNHITNVVGYFKGKVIHWDVVNEAFNDDGTFRNTTFYQHIGEAYIPIAFNAARAADPDVKLFINDYNLEYDAKATAMANLVTKLRAQGVPIDGIGSQGHLVVGSLPSTVASNLALLASTGVEVAITELDIRAPTPISATDLAQQAADYTTVVNACLAVSSCVGIETWGISDAFSWIPSVFSGYGDALPYDADFQPKAAREAIAAALA
ncbi:hypothetical protein HK100_011277 [Physocladia obscura]|uniref:Beta-xylanase n=1 Tax=Physocladia obscura TaxID=109957 RepID=A0AAD5T230_9FUNG|nr:hypothetical protein HK100_011277 [Physocladia obscura]